MNKNGSIMVGAICFAVFGAKSASATPANVIFGGDGQGASLYSYAYVNADANGNSGVPYGQTYTDGEDSSLVLPTAPLTATASYVTTSDTQGTLSAFTAASSTASATFETPSAGQIEFSGAISSTLDSDYGYTEGFTPQLLEYNFTPTQDSVLNVSYSFLASGSNIPSNCYYYLCEREVEIQNYTNGSSYYALFSGSSILNSDINQSGVLSIILNKNDFYSILFDDEYNISGVGPYSAAYEGTFYGTGSSKLSYDDKYSFSIDAVSPAPEPSTWALMIAGLASIGLALRGRRRPTATALA